MKARPTFLADSLLGSEMQRMSSSERPSDVPKGVDRIKAAGVPT